MTRGVAVEVQYAVTSTDDDPGSERISSWADAVIQRMGEGESTEVCIRLVDAEESAVLNSRFRGQNKPTNVLSFGADVSLPESIERYLGDIVICSPVVQQEAGTQNKCLHDHYAHMVVHGMLHLYGFDHADPAEADAMENIEREILSRLGIKDPYRVA